MWLCSRNHLKIVEKFHFLFILSGPVLAAIAVTALALLAPNPPLPGSDAEFQFRHFEGPFTMSVIVVSLVITVLCLVTMKNGDGSKSESENGSNETLNIRGFDTEKALDLSSTENLTQVLMEQNLLKLQTTQQLVIRNKIQLISSL